MTEIKVLFVDDDENARKHYRSILRQEFPSFVISEAQDFEEGQKKIYDFKPDLIFMDIRLPGNGGFDLIRKIKDENLKIATIVLTGYDIPEYRREAKRLGCCAFIYKGSDSIGKIVDAVKKCLPDIG